MLCRRASIPFLRRKGQTRAVYSGRPIFPHIEHVLDGFRADPSLEQLLDEHTPRHMLRMVHNPERIRFEELCRQHPHRVQELAFIQGKRNSHRATDYLRRNDPLFTTTIHMLLHMLDMLPPTAAKFIKQATDNHLPSFLALYKEMRQWADATEHRRIHRKYSRPDHPQGGAS